MVSPITCAEMLWAATPGKDANLKVGLVLGMARQTLSHLHPIFVWAQGVAALP